MAIDQLTLFLEEAPIDPASAWDFDALTKLSSFSVPDAFYSDQKSLLCGDQYRLWMRWFLEGLLSPHVIANDTGLMRSDVLSVVVQKVNDLYRTVEEPRRQRLSEKMTDHLFAEILHVRGGYARDYATASTRLDLLTAQSPARCYICGFAFPQEAVDAFRRVAGRNPIQLPSRVDVLRPRGLVKRDLGIEIDHVVPVALGGSGQSNLRLACGWCNKHKSDRVSLYEASFLPTVPSGFMLGSNRLFELPHPFWVVRTLATRKKCQHYGGCTHTSATSELFIALRDWKGSPNPTNLVVVCGSHDPVAGARMHLASDVQANIWR